MTTTFQIDYAHQRDVAIRSIQIKWPFRHGNSYIRWAIREDIKAIRAANVGLSGRFIRCDKEC